MSPNKKGVPPLADAPSPVDDATRAIAQLLNQHEAAATRSQRLVERLTAAMGSAGFMLWFTLVMGLWLGINLSGSPVAAWAVDPPPFHGLHIFLALAAVYVALIILTTQRRADLLAMHSSQHILKLTILTELKVAKVIALLEEVRRENPLLENRLDREALVMAEPADPDHLLQPVGVAAEGSPPSQTQPET